MVGKFSEIVMKEVYIGETMMEEEEGGSNMIRTKEEEQGKEVKRKMIPITYCSGRKNEQEELLDAIERYQSSRIDEVYDLHGEDLMILSGVYGILGCRSKIPYYDHLLQWNELGKMKDIMVKQFRKLNPTNVIFYIKWLSQLQYKALIMMVCSELNIPLQIIDLTPKEEEEE